MTASDRILRQREVIEITGLSRTTIWRKMKAKQFPQAVNLTQKSIGWYKSEIDAWMSALSRTKAA